MSFKRYFEQPKDTKEVMKKCKNDLSGLPPVLAKIIINEVRNPSDDRWPSNATGDAHDVL
jgi:hypothetical protein